MPEERTLVIVGASARAAAFSALRAGLRPWCVDLFADADLRACCPATAIALTDYPRRFPELIRSAPPGPWMYAGGLENHPRLVERMANERPLWGNGRSVLERVRSPERLARLFHDAGIACPSISMTRLELDRSKRWLVKPLSGAGGIGIHFLTDEPGTLHRRVYYQEFLDGPSYSAVYLGMPRGSMLLGLTHQLVGESWLRAGPFQYCGTVGPLTLDADANEQATRIGNVLANEGGLRGLFGVDFIRHHDILMPVEVNPRYTASVEVIEHATGVRALALHRQVFEASVDCVAKPNCGGMIGKMILFAREPVNFPIRGPWSKSNGALGSIEAVPAFADIPAPGTTIQSGWPVLSFFVEGGAHAEILANSRSAAQYIEQSLYGSPRNEHSG